MCVQLVQANIAFHGDVGLQVELVEGLLPGLASCILDPGPLRWSMESASLPETAVLAILLLVSNNRSFLPQLASIMMAVDFVSALAGMVLPPHSARFREYACRVLELYCAHNGCHQERTHDSSQESVSLPIHVLLGIPLQASCRTL